jgi:alanyl-tRNA synthetase
MPLPLSDTIVTYPSGDTMSRGLVIHVESLPDGRAVVLLDRSAAHPVDTAWPDQPADRATLHTADGVFACVDVVTGGIHEGRLHLGPDLPVRSGTDGWTFVVAHILDGQTPEVGTPVRVEVDREHRAALSAGHTACHLAALALDAVLAEHWTKPAPLDAVGHPAFDALAIQSSHILPHGSTDLYRLGKSLRRKGFPADAFADPDEIARGVDALLAEWIGAGGTVRIDAESDALSARRMWRCELPVGSAAIPCGGTHLTDIAQLGHAGVSFEVRTVDSATEVTMTTTVTPAP